MKIVIALLSIAVFMGATAPAHAGPRATPVYVELMDHYEAIRLALLAETTESVGRHAKAMAATAAGLRREFDPAKVGIEPDDAENCMSLLAELEIAAARLARAELMQEAVDSFGQLSDRMIRFSNLVNDEASVVVYCSMVKKAWLQPEGEIGNPYAGKEMARCGEVVSKR